MTSIALSVTDSMLGSLRQTRPWVMFLSIMGFIFSGFAVLGGLWMFFAFSLMGAMPHHGDVPALLNPLFGTIFGVLYLGMALFLYLIPCIILFRYSTAIGRIAGTDGQMALEDALLRQKSFWKYMGILMIVMLALYVLFIVGGIIAAVVIGLHAAH